MSIPNCTLITTGYDPQIIKLPLYLIICCPLQLKDGIIKERRQLGLDDYTLVINNNLNKFKIFQDCLAENHFKTDFFAWLDWDLVWSTNFSVHKLLNILNSLKISSKNEKNEKNGKIYLYRTEPQKIFNGFFLCDDLTSAEIFNENLDLIADKYYDRINISYGSKEDIFDNFLSPWENIGYVIFEILKPMLNSNYFKECFDCSQTLINLYESYQVDMDYHKYMETLFVNYIATYYYKNEEAKGKVEKIVSLCERNPYFLEAFNKNKNFYRDQFSYAYTFKKHKIGVAIPSFQRDIPLIKRCLDSIEKQTFKPEVVVISLSETNPIILDLPQYSFNLKIICIVEKKNAAENRNIAANYILENTDCTIISFFDSDDEMVPKRLEFIEKCFSEENCDFVLHSYSKIVNYKARFDMKLNDYFYYRNALDLHTQHCGLRVRKDILPINEDITHGNISIKRKVWKREKFNVSSQFINWEDCEYAKRLLTLGYINCYIPAQLTKYHKYRPSPSELEEILSMGNKKLDRRIFVFWTGDNQMTESREESLKKMEKSCGVPVILITNQNLKEWILPFSPLHPAYEFLSYVHRADYLRCYFMHHYGGGYSDIKSHNHSWVDSFNILDENKMCYGNGYIEVEGGVALIDDRNLYNEMNVNYKKLIGNGAYIFKPDTKFTQEWFNKLNSILDQKLELLKNNPAKDPRDHKGLILNNIESPYPIKWTEILGNIFHPLVYKYNSQILQTLVPPIF